MNCPFRPWFLTLVVATWRPQIIAGAQNMNKFVTETVISTSAQFSYLNTEHLLKYVCCVYSVHVFKATLFFFLDWNSK